MIRRRVRLLAWLGIGGVAQFVLAALVLHAFQAVPRYMSEFAHGRFSLFWSLSLYSLAGGGVALGLALQPCLGRASRAGRAGVLLLWLAAAGALAIATFPVDRTPHPTTLAGAIHEDAALATFALLCLAILLVGLALRRNPASRSLGHSSLAVGGAVAALCASYAVASAATWPAVSVLQRVLVALVAAWFLLLAGWVLLSATRHGEAPPRPAPLRMPLPRGRRRQVPQERRGQAGLAPGFGKGREARRAG